LKIAISMRVTEEASYAEARDALSHDWLNWAAARGHMAFPVPNIVAGYESYIDTIAPDALILTGGNDLQPRSGAEGVVSEIRNAAEMTLLDTALKKGLRVLGVCRGLHIINTYYGGGLTSDICTSSSQNHVAVNHEVCLQTPLSEIAGRDVVEVNSFHNQGVAIDQTASTLRPAALCVADDLVEALIHYTAPVLAVQWHPERPNPAADIDVAIIDRFLTDGAFWQGSDD
jgi:gamma-glutamyl-gamma-aminobutyrate hydrolase PuuD